MEVLYYESLVETYYENLHSQLRSFRSGPDFIESWVHDEDHLRSLVALFEAASESGIASLEVVIKRETLEGISVVGIEGALKEFGAAQVIAETQTLRLRVTFQRGSIWQVSPRYAKSLLERARAITFEKEAGEFAFSAVERGITLGCEVDEGGIVRKASFRNAQGLLRPLLDCLCEEMLNRPLQEASEHGALRVENRLRDRTMMCEPCGLITPENADPIFAFANRLIRAVYQSYLDAGHKPRRPSYNEWEDPLSPEWKALDEKERRDRVQSVLTHLESDFAFAAGSLQVVALLHARRVYLARTPATQLPAFGSCLMRIERALKARCERSLEIVLESLEDKNRREGRTQIAGRNLTSIKRS